MKYGSTAHGSLVFGGRHCGAGMSTGCQNAATIRSAALTMDGRKPLSDPSSATFFAAQRLMTKRPESLLTADFAKCADEMHRRIDGKRMLVIGGAGTIGSNYVKASIQRVLSALSRTPT